MERKIPFQFDISFEEGGLHPTSDPELYSGKVRVFYKYSIAMVVISLTSLPLN